MRKEEGKGRGKGDREADAAGKERRREEAGSERGGMDTSRNLKKR